MKNGELEQISIAFEITLNFAPNPNIFPGIINVLMKRTSGDKSHGSKRMIKHLKG